MVTGKGQMTTKYRKIGKVKEKKKKQRKWNKIKKKKLYGLNNVIWI